MAYGMIKRSAPRRRGQNLRRRYDDLFERTRGGNRFYKQISGVHKFQRAFKLTQWNAGAALTYYWGYTFQLVDVPDYSELSNLFDSYRITGVKVTFIPQENTAEVTNGGGLPTLFIVKDLNDATAPTSISGMLQYPACKMVQLNRPYSLYFKPRLAQVAVQGATTGTAELKTGAWNSIDSPGMTHYGLKLALQTVSSTNVDVYVKLYIECKNPR